MLPQEKLENIITSLWSFTESRYTLTSKYLWGYSGLNTQNLSEWVQFSYQNSTRVFHRQSDQNYPGNTVHLDFMANIYVKQTENFMRSVTIRDTLVGIFRRCIIPILDWTGDKARLGEIIGQDIIMDRPVAGEDDLSRHILIFDMQYMEQFDRAHS